MSPGQSAPLGLEPFAERHWSALARLAVVPRAVASRWVLGCGVGWVAVGGWLWAGVVRLERVWG